MTPLAAVARAALAPVPADQELMRRVLEEQAVARVLPTPSWSEYLLHVVRTALETVMGPLFRYLPMAGVARVLLIAVLAVAVLALVALLVRVVRRRARRAAQPDPEAAAGPPPAPPRAPDPAAWRMQLDAHLGRGDVAAALDALWWWLATTVARGAVDPSWTTRELLARAGRTDLGALSGALDRLTYAAARPQPADVRAFALRLEAAL
jgi:hypothetical protein